MTEPKFSHFPLSTNKSLDCNLVEQALLQTPAFNKGSAFPQDEREAFGLVGLLPTEINTLEDQAKRAYDQYSIRRTPLGKNTFMNSLKEQNEVLFYRLIQDHIKEMFPIIYTPTEGDAIANYSRLFRRPEGCFLSIANPDDVEAAMDKWGPAEDMDVIACSDGEQILGPYTCSFDLSLVLT
jgi:malate dehydrogenase (oxaloacetate-decarboxylating)